MYTCRNVCPLMSARQCMYMSVYVYVRTHVCMCVFMFVYKRMCVSVCICTCTCVCLRIHACMYACMSMRVYQLPYLHACCPMYVACMHELVSCHLRAYKGKLSTLLITPVEEKQKPLILKIPREASKKRGRAHSPVTFSFL